jgi:hypothetical protein
MVQHYAAGVLPFTWQHGNLLFLVGKDVRDSSFSDFGGKSERMDKGCPINTAVREFYEETYGALVSAKFVKSRICSGQCIILKSVTQNGYEYTMYLIEIPYQHTFHAAFHKALSFVKTRNMGRVYVEKTDVQWVTYPMLQRISKRSPFANTVISHDAILRQLASSTMATWKSSCLSSAPIRSPLAPNTTSALPDSPQNISE